VLLESRVGTLGKVREPGLGVERRFGVKVSRIGVSSNAGDVVVAADDPRLIAGWHDAEQTASALWRWTDGSAEVPWHGVSGPAIVTVRCGTLEEYVLDDPKIPTVQ
jgi:hypothetical protein